MILVMLTGCGMLSTTKVVDNFCVIYEPVRNYLESTEAVMQQIELNNAMYLERCYD
jgi:hypothetical protein